MASCSSCGTTVSCEGGCGIICWDNCAHCSSWCEPTGGGSVSVTVGPAVLRSSDEVKVCTKGLSSYALVPVLEAHLGTALVRARESEELASGTVSFSGSVSELLEHLGLRQDYSDSTA